MTTSAAPGPGGASRRGDVRDALLDAARHLFAEQGYDATTTRQIAAHAGTTTTTLFRHFGTKANLHRQALEPGAETGGPARRPYRSGAETRARLVLAAAELFSTHGYARTTTSQIADRAGVAEVALFRAFESKANLFRVAVLEPLGALVRSYGEQWEAEDVPGLSHLVDGAFIETFYQSMLDHRGALMTLFTTRVHESLDIEDYGEQQGAMAEILGPFEAAIRREVDAEHLSAVDVAVASRLTIAMIGGTVFFRDWLFSDADAIDSDRIVAEMRGFIDAGFRRG